MITRHICLTEKQLLFKGYELGLSGKEEIRAYPVLVIHDPPGMEDWEKLRGDHFCGSLGDLNVWRKKEMKREKEELIAKNKAKREERESRVRESRSARSHGGGLHRLPNVLDRDMFMDEEDLSTSSGMGVSPQRSPHRSAHREGREDDDSFFS